MIPEDYEVIDVVSDIKFKTGLIDGPLVYQTPVQELLPHETEILYRNKKTGEITKLVLTVMDRKWVLPQTYIDPSIQIICSLAAFEIKEPRAGEIYD